MILNIYIESSQKDLFNKYKIYFFNNFSKLSISINKAFQNFQ